jgi:hypothetical protein
LKSIFVLIVLIGAGIYGTGAVALSERGANRFLDALEDLSIQGKGDDYCARLHDELEVSIDDHSAEPAAKIRGGKKEFCDYVKFAAKGMDLLGVQSQVERNDFAVTRSFLHPWTAEITYDETRTTHMSKVNVTLDTQSHDELTLVQTFDGVKLRKIKSEAWKVN